MSLSGLLLLAFVLLTEYALARYLHRRDLRKAEERAEILKHLDCSTCKGKA